MIKNKSADSVACEIKDQVLIVTMNRAEVRNAFNPEMINELTHIFRNRARQAGLRAVVLQGAGESFSAGADLQWMQEMAKYSLDENVGDAVKLDDMFAAIRACPHPTIAYVQGHAFGGALGLIAACDISVAEDETQFGFTEVRLGLIPAVISPYVKEKMNQSDALRLMLTGEIFLAPEAKSSGLISAYGTREESQKKLYGWLTAFRTHGPEAIGAMKQLWLKLSSDSDPAQVRDLTTQAIAERRASVEGQEGLKAFFEKRRPQWPERPI